MVTAFHYDTNEIRRLSLKEIAQLVQSPRGVLWVDLEDPLEAEEETLLVSIFDFHPLSVEDCQRGKEEDGHLPKVEDFGEYLFVIFNPVETVASDPHRSAGADFEIQSSQLSAFLARNVLVTHHYRSLPSITNAAQLCVKNPQALGRGVDYLFHVIIDDVVDQYVPILERLDDAIEQTEEEVFHRADQQTMVRILQIKKNIITLRKVALYQREMLNRLSRGEFSLITREEIIYYRNVYDHLVRTTDLTESYREAVSGVMEAYLSVTSNRLGQVMKVLTIISTIFLPLGVITGFFGMNFDTLPGRTWEYGVAATAFLMGVVALVMLWVFKRKKWV